jgi:hypothetical protein
MTTSTRLAGAQSYTWSGLRVVGDLELKDLQGWQGPAQDSDTVDVVHGPVPADLPQGQRVDSRQQVSPSDYLFHRAGVASFLVSGGRRITIAPEPGVPQATVAAFLLGRPFAALACQRGWLPLHGGCVLTGACGTVVAAEAGTGKSTLLAALQARGLALVSDDSAIVRNLEGRPWVWPSSQRIRLRADAAARFPVEARGAEPVRPGLDKLALPFRRPVSGPVPLKNLLFLTRGAAQAGLSRVDRLPSLDLLNTHLNRPRLAELILGRAKLFQQLAWLSQAIECHHLAVPDDLGRLDEVADLVCARFG